MHKHIFLTLCLMFNAISIMAMDDKKQNGNDDPISYQVESNIPTSPTTSKMRKGATKLKDSAKKLLNRKSDEENNKNTKTGENSVNEHEPALKIKKTYPWKHIAAGSLFAGMTALFGYIAYDNPTELYKRSFYAATAGSSILMANQFRQAYNPSKAKYANHVNAFGAGIIAIGLHNAKFNPLNMKL